MLFSEHSYHMYLNCAFLLNYSISFTIFVHLYKIEHLEGVVFLTMLLHSTCTPTLHYILKKMLISITILRNLHVSVEVRKVWPWMYLSILYYTCICWCKTSVVINVFVSMFHAWLTMSYFWENYVYTMYLYITI